MCLCVSGTRRWSLRPLAWSVTWVEVEFMFFTSVLQILAWISGNISYITCNHSNADSLELVEKLKLCKLPLKQQRGGWIGFTQLSIRVPACLLPHVWAQQWLLQCSVSVWQKSNLGLCILCSIWLDISVCRPFCMESGEVRFNQKWLPEGHMVMYIHAKCGLKGSELFII